jgi:hypothetical protein
VVGLPGGGRWQASVGEGAEARENGPHHLFSLLCDHVLYSRVDVDLQCVVMHRMLGPSVFHSPLVTSRSDAEECFHQVSVLIYSLTTGLPLRISFTHGVDASGCLSCGLKWESTRTTNLQASACALARVSGYGSGAGVFRH